MDKIEKLRQELYKAIDKKDYSKILKISEMLDKEILKYYRTCESKLTYKIS